MGISPLPNGFPAGQRFGSNPTSGPNRNVVLLNRFGNYQPNGHTGDDYPAPTGTPVYATADGVVMWAGPGTGLPAGDTAAAWESRWYLDREHVGNLVAIEHTERGGYTTLSYHLHKVTVAPWQHVRKGDKVGEVGSTGRSTGSHLHIDVVPHTYPWDNGMWGRVDPAPYTNEKKASTMIWLTDLADRLRKDGLTVVEVPGWKTRGYAAQGFYDVAGVLHHHTATNRAAFTNSNMPTLNLLVGGRSDLPGPLCNLGFGRDGTVYVIAAGWANHAGRGRAPGIPNDMGNGYLIGIEAESSGVAPWDWTKDQLRVWPYLAASLEDNYLLKRAPELRLQLGHKEYSTEGKIDPAGINMDEFRTSINRVLNVGGAAAAPAPKEQTLGEWIMATPEQKLDEAVARAMRRVLREEHPKIGPDGKANPKDKTSIIRELQWTGRNFDDMRRANATTHKLLNAVATAVQPARVALAVWGYVGGAARKINGKTIDAYETINQTFDRTEAKGSTPVVSPPPVAPKEATK